jgi:two-component system, OmpR family, KDP operon response regulator KdpE
VTSAATILVVDDEPQIQRFLKPGLTAGGYNVTSAEAGQAAVKMIAATAPDLVILDLGLPDMDGKEVIREVRSWSKVPIIVLSARDREAEKIAALDLGADDYVNKPFGIGELLARIRTALRHVGRSAETANVLRMQGINLDIAAHSVTRNGEVLHLTPKEFDLLALLMRNAGRVLTHRQILSAVWGPAHVEDMQYLRVFIGQLRLKLEADPSEPRLVLTEPGIGYRFAGEAD